MSRIFVSIYFMEKWENISEYPFRKENVGVVKE